MVNFFKGTKITEHTDITDLFLLKNLKVPPYKNETTKIAPNQQGVRSTGQPFSRNQTLWFKISHHRFRGYEILISRAGFGLTSSFLGSVMHSNPSQYLAEIFSPSTRSCGMVKLRWNDW